MPAYEARSKLRASIQRTRRNLKSFEQRYGVTTPMFLREATAFFCHFGKEQFGAANHYLGVPWIDLTTASRSL
ncbi:MAG: hypothetical protein ACKO4U_14295 [Caldilinea sp.]|jgi:hypothetical protein